MRSATPEPAELTALYRLYDAGGVLRKRARRMSPLMDSRPPLCGRVAARGLRVQRTTTRGPTSRRYGYAKGSVMDLNRLAVLRGDEENSQGETGSGSDGQEGNPSQGCGDNKS